MLKIYNTLEEVPEALREHYVKSDGKYVPQLSDDHPVLTHNKTLLTEKVNATNKVRELEADIAAASEKSVPRGHVAVLKSDAELLDKYKAHGTPDEVGAIKTEYATLKERDTKRTRDDSLRQVSKALGFNEEAFTRLPNLPDFTSKPNKDGKTIDWFAQVKDDKGVITEKPAREFVEASADIAPFMASLKSTDGVKVPVTSSSTTQPTTASVFEQAKAFGEDWNKAAAAGTNVAERFGLAPKQASA